MAGWMSMDVDGWYAPVSAFAVLKRRPVCRCAVRKCAVCR